MGLDMYMRGYKYLLEDAANNRNEDGYRVVAVEIELGYWRKHPDLHGYIVREFADGEDKCQEIPLNAKALQKCIEAVKKGVLPRTEGFFFGSSAGHWLDAEGVEATTKMLHGAIKWLADQKQGSEYRSVLYQASW
jgi:hypothetical protein